MGASQSHPIPRRQFIMQATALAAVASAGCAVPTEPSASQGRLTARPMSPVTSIGKGRHVLNLGWARDGFLYVPDTYDPAVPAPLIVLLHGGGGTSAEWAASPLDRLVDDLGILLLCPDSRGDVWDVINPGQFGPDVAFIDDALRWTFQRCNVAPGGIGIAGFSNGASYALSLGLTNGDLFSRIGAFSPGMVRAAGATGAPAVFVSHGTSDQVIPIEFGRAIVAALEGEGYLVTYEEYDGGHTLPFATARRAFEWFVA